MPFGPTSNIAPKTQRHAATWPDKL
jgi:hypothetical protein